MARFPARPPDVASGVPVVLDEADDEEMQLLDDDEAWAARGLADEDPFDIPAEPSIFTTTGEQKRGRRGGGSCQPEGPPGHGVTPV